MARASKAGRKGDKPTEAQLANGTYARKFVMHAETATEAMAFISRHDPVARWEAGGRLEPHQVTVINMCHRLWDLAGMETKVTASYGERIGSSSSFEHRAASKIEAREDLHRYQGYVPPAYWSIFENVCRWGEPAGIAGGRLGFGDRAAAERAHLIVCMVTDTIAMNERL